MVSEGCCIYMCVIVKDVDGEASTCSILRRSTTSSASRPAVGRKVSAEFPVLHPGEPQTARPAVVKRRSGIKTTPCAGPDLDQMPGEMFQERPQCRNREN